MSRRAPNLTDNGIERIVMLLDSWEGRLTWQAFIQRVRRHTGHTYTRQALAKHARVQAAFSQAARRPIRGGRLPMTYAQRREATIVTLRNEVSRLRSENDMLLEQFVRWLSNASDQGMSFGQLNRPLQPIDRAGRKRRGPADDVK